MATPTPTSSRSASRRTGGQPVEHRVLAGRLVRRQRRAARGTVRPARHRHRHRRIPPAARERVRHHLDQTDVRPVQRVRRDPVDVDARSSGSDGPQHRRRLTPARSHGGRRSQLPRHVRRPLRSRGGLSPRRYGWGTAFGRQAFRRGPPQRRRPARDARHAVRRVPRSRAPSRRHRPRRLPADRCPRPADRRLRRDGQLPPAVLRPTRRLPPRQRGDGRRHARSAGGPLDRLHDVRPEPDGVPARLHRMFADNDLDAVLVPGSKMDGAKRIEIAGVSVFGGTTGDVRWANLTGTPVVCTPAGRSSATGLPFGVQIGDARGTRRDSSRSRWNCRRPAPTGRRRPRFPRHRATSRECRRPLPDPDRIDQHRQRRLRIPFPADDGDRSGLIERRQSPIPASRARTIAVDRSGTPSLVRTFDTWLRTVLGLSTSRREMVALSWPRAIRSSTSCSRSVISRNTLDRARGAATASSLWPRPRRRRSGRRWRPRGSPAPPRPGRRP